MVSRGTPVKLFDGRVIHIEDVRAGDVLEQHESGYVPTVERVVERTLPGYSLISTAAPGLEIDSRAYMKIRGIWDYPTRRCQTMLVADAVVYDVYLVVGTDADDANPLSYMAGGHEIAAANNPVYGGSVSACGYTLPKHSYTLLVYGRVNGNGNANDQGQSQIPPPHSRYGLGS